MRAALWPGPATRTSAPTRPATQKLLNSTSTRPRSPTSNCSTRSSPCTTPPPSTARVRTGARNTARPSSSTRPNRKRRPAPKSSNSPPKGASSPIASSLWSSRRRPSGAPRNTTSAILRSAVRQAATFRKQGTGNRDQGTESRQPQTPALRSCFAVGLVVRYRGFRNQNRVRSRVHGSRSRLILPQAGNPPQQHGDIHRLVGVHHLASQADDALVVRLGMRMHGGGDNLPHSLDNEPRGGDG